MDCSVALYCVILNQNTPNMLKYFIQEFAKIIARTSH